MVAFLILLKIRKDREIDSNLKGIVKMKIPYLNLQIIHQDIMKELKQAAYSTIDRESFISGRECKIFEERYANFCECKYCIGVGNGLDAIRLILQGYQIGVGDEVILPANTFIATALAVSYVGAKPIFVDVDSKTYNIDVNQIEKKINERTKAIIAVHLYGKIGRASCRERV